MPTSVEHKTWQTSVKPDAKATGGYLSKEPTVTERAFNKNTACMSWKLLKCQSALNADTFVNCPLVLHVLLSTPIKLYRMKLHCPWSMRWFLFDIFWLAISVVEESSPHRHVIWSNNCHHFQATDLTRSLATTLQIRHKELQARWILEKMRFLFSMRDVGVHVTCSNSLGGEGGWFVPRWVFPQVVIDMAPWTMESVNQWYICLWYMSIQFHSIHQWTKHELAGLPCANAPMGPMVTAPKGS